MECHAAKREIWDLNWIQPWKKESDEKKAYQQISWRIKCRQLKSEQGEGTEEISQNTSQCDF